MNKILEPINLNNGTFNIITTDKKGITRKYYYSNHKLFAINYYRKGETQQYLEKLFDETEFMFHIKVYDKNGNLLLTNQFFKHKGVIDFEDLIEETDFYDNGKLEWKYSYYRNGNINKEYYGTDPEEEKFKYLDPYKRKDF